MKQHSYLAFALSALLFAASGARAEDTKKPEDAKAADTTKVEAKDKDAKDKDAKKDAKTDAKDAKKDAKDAKSDAKGGNPVVEFKTSEGTIKIALDAKAAPVSVKNFLGYVGDKFYDGTIFHRVISGFMIQGGGFTVDGGKLKEKTTKAPIENEAKNGLKNDRGTIAMARTSDPNSATAQFFINHVDNAMLNAPNPDGFGYAVFGKVTEGMDVVDKIAKAPTGVKDGMSDVPTSDVKILSATVVSGGA